MCVIEKNGFQEQMSFQLNMSNYKPYKYDVEILTLFFGFLYDYEILYIFYDID